MKMVKKGNVFRLAIVALAVKVCFKGTIVTPPYTTSVDPIYFF